MTEPSGLSSPASARLSPDELARVGRFLDAHRDRFALALVRIPRLDVRREFAKWAEDFSREHNRPFRLLEGAGLTPIQIWEKMAEPAKCGEIALLTGLDEAFRDPNGEMLSLLNRQRERLAQLLPGPVLLVLGDSALDRFEKDAADLADWHGASFEFRPSAPSFGLSAREPGATEALSRELIESRIALLEDQAIGPVSDEVRARLWDETARRYRDLGRYTEARDLHRQALDLVLRHFGPDDPTVATLRSNLGITLRYLGDYQEARKQMELALDSDLRHLGLDDSDVTVRRSNFAIILRDLGEYQEARKQIELALESDLHQLGPDDSRVATRRSNLAAVLSDLGEFAGARKQIELALESDLRSFGPDHPKIATERTNLAIILQYLGEHREARTQIELALESDLRRWGRDHPEVAMDRTVLAMILYALGESAAALREVDLALEVFREALPAQHPKTRHAEQFRKSVLGNTAD